MNEKDRNSDVKINIDDSDKEEIKNSDDVISDYPEKNDLKIKRNIYLASSVLCTLVAGTVGVSVIVKSSSEIDSSGELEDKLDNDGNAPNSRSIPSPVSESKKGDSIEAIDENNIKDAIDVAKASSAEAIPVESSDKRDETAPVQENIDPNPEYSYNLEEQINPGVQSPSSQPVISTGQAMTSNNVQNAMRFWNYFEYYGYTYGVDPYLLVAMSAQESRGDHDSTIPGGKYYKGYGYGIMQIEKPGIVTKKLTAFNHVTKSYDIMYINSGDDVNSVEMNIKAGAMQLAQKARENNYNPLVTIQGYNYGSAGIKYTLSYYVANGDASRVEEIYGNGKGEHLLYYLSLNNNDWVTIPTSSGLTARDWYSSEGWKRFGAGKGDRQYIEHVMRYYRGSGRPYIIKDSGERVDF